MVYLSLMAIFKNETMNLKVWLDHYIWQGVDHFYLIDNGSTDNPLNILQEYIDNKIVTYNYCPEKHMQVQHYRNMYTNNDIQNKTKWLIVCDLDEFFYGTRHKLSLQLTHFEDYQIIYCNWYMFGSDNLINHPEDIRLNNLHREKNLHILEKYIVNVAHIKSANCIDVHGISDINDTIRHDNDFICLNHYPIQSLDFFQNVKMKRGDVHRSEVENIRDMNYFNAYNAHTDYEDCVLKNIILNPPSDYYTI